jgi:hypothetical protein
VEAGLVAAPEPTPEPDPQRQFRAPKTRASERAPKRPITGYEIARSAIRNADAHPQHILGACQSIATAQRVLAAAVRSGDAPSVEQLTAGQASQLLQDLARSREAELWITVPDPDIPIAELTGPARRATADALKPRDHS